MRDGRGRHEGEGRAGLQKGDLIFVADANWGQAAATPDRDGTTNNEDKDFFGGKTVNNFNDGFADTADLYTITKIWTAQMTSTTATKEDRYRITVDKNINWDGSKIASPDGTTGASSTTGYVQIVKFTPATTGTFTYVSQCSNRGLCNGDDALCECFKGYTNDNCDTQSSLAV